MGKIFFNSLGDFQWASVAALFESLVIYIFGKVSIFIREKITMKKISFHVYLFDSSPKIIIYRI
ncbi:hypothetical protein [Lactococcus lactis]|uniref:hypothetical protein n=1 Tax=Lactococcus lactis TaxID=1358 RepID=UPI0005C576FC|nr:hypothetical protein [Lactococcus lactis]